MSQTKYRLGVAVTAREMPDICRALAADFPELAKAIEKQWLEIMNSGVNIFPPWEWRADEPIAGLVRCPIELVTGIRD